MSSFAKIGQGALKVSDLHLLLCKLNGQHREIVAGPPRQASATAMGR